MTLKLLIILCLMSLLKIFKKFDKILLELKKSKIQNKMTKSFDEHVKSQVGETLASMFFKNYPEKIWESAQKNDL